MISENLIEIRENHSFNIKNLEAWFHSNIKNFGTFISIKQFVGGQSNPTFFIKSEEGNHLILRKKPPREFITIGACNRERI